VTRLSSLVFCALTLAALLPSSARAHDPGERRKLALGVQLDLFPTVISAVNGRFGGAPQIWVGIDHVRVRFVGAHLEPPDSFAFQDGFIHPTTTAFATLVDYTFGEHFDRWWIGAGFEQWTQTIGHEGVQGDKQWVRTVATVGGGYIFRFAHNVFIDPWLGLHMTLNPSPVMVDTYEYNPPIVVPSASVKVGWFADL
jgi:hypothetical protein